MPRRSRFVCGEDFPYTERQPSDMSIALMQFQFVVTQKLQATVLLKRQHLNLHTCLIFFMRAVLLSVGELVYVAP